MIITHLVYNERNKEQVTNFAPDIKCVFAIKPFEGKYMAYVEASFTLHKGNQQLLNGNSLWNLGAMDLDKLTAKIKSYTSIQDVIKDFDA
jgi:hypothetical protein